jgi:ABC-type glycerol-3-phosphate transport system substrate-binding protein
VLLPITTGPYSSPMDKSVHTGDLITMMGLYNQTLFEIQHPKVKVEYVNFDMWNDNFRSQLAVALSANQAPAYYVARDLPQTIYQGIYADLTPLMLKWDQFKNQPEMAVHEGKVDGKYYTMAQGELSALVIRYRKDWFREAGIFNERGEPGPRSDWTWDDFRKYAKMLTDPKKNRYGFIGEVGDFMYNPSHGIDPLYIPDPTGKRTWVFNDQDPELLTSLQNARDMVNKDKSVYASGSVMWFQWHSEFDASRAAMIVSWAAHPPRESLEQPYKFGKDHLFKDVVGMAPPPRGPSGLRGLKPITNLIGFDPTLNPEELEAAFDWCKSYFYGDLFANRMRQLSQEAKVKGRRSALYADLLALPYESKEKLLDQPFEAVFPRDYLETYKAIRASRYPPLPREFGLREPATDDFAGAVRAMYSEAITTNTDLKQIVKKAANVANTNLLNFHEAGDRERMKRYIAARSEFYRQNFPQYYETVWKRQMATYYKAP